MKKLTKKVVIATTTGLASMILNAACGYGPPVDYENPNGTYGVTSDDASVNVSDDASSEISVSDSYTNTSAQDSSSAASTESPAVISEDKAAEGASGEIIMEEVPSDAPGTLDSLDDYLVEPGYEGNYKIPEVPAVYGPPTVDG